MSESSWQGTVAAGRFMETDVLMRTAVPCLHPSGWNFFCAKVSFELLGLNCHLQVVISKHNPSHLQDKLFFFQSAARGSRGQVCCTFSPLCFICLPSKYSSRYCIRKILYFCKDVGDITEYDAVMSFLWSCFQSIQHEVWPLGKWCYDALLYGATDYIDPHKLYAIWQ